MPRWPKGYVGINHETIGSDILSVLHAIRSPEQVLDEGSLKTLRGIDPNGWYPIGVLLGLMETVYKQLGRFTMVKMGRTLFKMSHEANFVKVAKSARDAIYGLDGLYKYANRGTAIGGWRVVSFEPGRAELEKTTPHLCIMEEGILVQALATLNIPATIEQPQCFRDGAPCCRFVITSRIADQLWTG